MDTLKKIFRGTASYVQYWRNNPVLTYRNGGTAPDFSEPFYVENITQDTEYVTLSRPVEVTKFDIEISTDKTTWITMPTNEGESYNTTQFILSPGSKIYIRTSTPSWSDPNNGDNHSNISGMSKVGGNIMSLIYGSNFTGQETSFPADTRCNFQGLFQNVSELVDAADVLFPVQYLPFMCYRDMFAGTSITVAPNFTCALGVIGDYSFHSTFGSCHNLIVAPSFSPNFNLSNGAYTFHVCFEYCTSLVNPPALPMTALNDGCYNEMFQYCTSLTSAPTLPATTLTQYCYHNMFQGCTSLTSAPTLPATTLAQACYDGMFRECTSLTTAPVISATTLASYCCMLMFYGCTSLTTAPALPATTLAHQCYSQMFQSCTSLTTAPVLPATTLASGCYSLMFNGCSNLASIECLATDISATSCTNEWVDGVAASGTFTKDASMSSWTTGNSGIPSGWTVQDAA